MAFNFPPDQQLEDMLSKLPAKYGAARVSSVTRITGSGRLKK
jgi:hypothetical protein